MEGVILSTTVLLTATARDKFIPTKKSLPIGGI